jgi:hypothetical protein
MFSLGQRKRLEKSENYCWLALVGKAHFVIYSMSKSLTLVQALASIAIVRLGKALEQQ